MNVDNYTMSSVWVSKYFGMICNSVFLQHCITRSFMLILSYKRHDGHLGECYSHIALLPSPASKSINTCLNHDILPVCHSRVAHLWCDIFSGPVPFFIRYNSAAVTYSSFLSTPPLFYLALNLQLSRVHFTAMAGEGGVNQVAGDKFNHPLPRHPRIKQEAV